MEILQQETVTDMGNTRWASQRTGEAGGGADRPEDKSRGPARSEDGHLKGK